MRCMKGLDKRGDGKVSASDEDGFAIFRRQSMFLEKVSMWKLWTLLLRCLISVARLHAARPFIPRRRATDFSGMALVEN